MPRQLHSAIAFCLFVACSSVASAQSAQPFTLGEGLWGNEGPSAFSSLIAPEESNLAISLGLNGATGNSENFNWLMGVDALRKSGLHTWVMDFDYAQASNDGVDTQKFALMNLKYDRSFEEGSPWSLFANSSFLLDQLRDFDIRIALNGGLGYKWIDTDDMLFGTRTGFGVSREFGGADDEWKPELVLGVDFRRSLSEEQELGVSVDYFPNVSDFSDYRLVADAFWQIKIASPDFFLRFSAIDRFDSTPGPAKENDIFYGVQLLWKPY